MRSALTSVGESSLGKCCEEREEAFARIEIDGCDGTQRPCLYQPRCLPLSLRM